MGGGLSTRQAGSDRLLGMQKPWTAEVTVDEATARSLVEGQFPSLAPARLAPLGEGWDNTAWSVNGTHVFRFPRRAIAVSLLEAEARVLPAIAARLPLPVPVPALLGRPVEGYPWPFAGYALIPGRIAKSAALDDRQREASAVPLARFLAALHAIPSEEALRLGAPLDTIHRLDVPRRGSQARARLAALELRGEVDAARFEEILAAPSLPVARVACLVHGDMHSGQVLVDEEGLVAGVIDWGDVHVGDPAIDLSIAHGFLPPSVHARFREAYGPIDDGTWRLARFKALHMAATLLEYGLDIRDEDLVRESRRMFDFLGATPPQ